MVGGVCPQYNFCKWCKGSGGGLGTYLEITASPLHMVYTIDTIYDSGATQPDHHNWPTCLLPIINKYTHPTSQHKLTLLTPFTRTVPPFPLPLLHHERHTQFTPAGYATPIAHYRLALIYHILYWWPKPHHDHMHKPFIRFSPGINTPNSQYSYTAFTPVVSPLPLSLITTTRVQHIHHLHIFRKYSHPHHHHGRRPFVPFHLLHQWCPPPPPNTTGVRYSLHVHHLHNFHRVLTHHPHSTRLQYLGHLPQ